MRAAVLGLVLAAVLCGPEALLPAAGADGKLDAVETRLKGGKAPHGKGRPGPGLSGGGDGMLALLLVDFFVNVAPYLLFPRYRFGYQDFPYAWTDGYLSYFGDTPWSSEAETPLPGRALTFELRGGYLVDSADLHGWRFYGKARLSWAFNVDADFIQFREWTDDALFRTLTFAKVDGLFNLSNSPWHDVDLGLGVSYLDGVDFFGGMNAKITADVFPLKPWGLHAAAGGSLFPGGILFEAEIGIGIFLHRFELRAGWRALWVDDIEMHGPTGEVAIWF